MNIDDFVAAVNSGATGLIGLQISTDGQALELGAMSIVSGQDVWVFSTASDSTLAFAGTTFPNVQVASGGMLTISGPVHITAAFFTLMLLSVNSGTVSLGAGVTIVRMDGTTPVLSGSLPGTLTAELNGVTVGTITRAEGGDPSVSPSAWADEVEWKEWDSDCANPDGHTFTVYMLPVKEPSFFGASDATGASRYQSVCEAVGLNTLVTGRTSWGMPSECQPFNCLQGCNAMSTGPTGYIFQRTGWGTDGSTDNAVKGPARR